MKELPRGHCTLLEQQAKEGWICKALREMDQAQLSTLLGWQLNRIQDLLLRKQLLTGTIGETDNIFRRDNFVC